MQYRIFTIPVLGGEAETENLNKFLRANKTVKVDKELVGNGDTAYWSFCVQYLLPQPATPIGERKDKVDYRAVLDDAQFKVFSMLRRCRKAVAEEDAVPAFAVFLDAELAELSKMDEIDVKAFASINGVGTHRVEKYAQRMLAKIYEESGKPDRADS